MKDVNQRIGKQVSDYQTETNSRDRIMFLELKILSLVTMNIHSKPFQTSE